MFEQTFKNIDDILRKDAGCGGELDYVEQTSWVLFLKYLDDLECDRATSAELTGKSYTPIIDNEYQWGVWAAPKLEDGKIDHNALTGDDLLDFVNVKLFPYFKKFKLSAESADTVEYKIGEIFTELKNRLQSGYNLREVINLIDELRFRTHAEKHEMSRLYEDAGFDACIGRGVAAIRYSDNQEWINYFILSSRQKIYELGTGATFPNVSSQILKEITIPIPPLKEQKAIVRHLDAIRAETQKLEAIYQKKIADLEELKKSVLQKAFSGQLTMENGELTIENEVFDKNNFASLTINYPLK